MHEEIIWKKNMLYFLISWKNDILKKIWKNQNKKIGNNMDSLEIDGK